MLVDGGPPEAGPAVIDAVRRAGAKRLDWIIGTHPHADHIGGLVDVLRAVPVTAALDPGYLHGTALQRTYLALLKEVGVRTTVARRGGRYPLAADLALTVLAPEALLEGTGSDANNNSVVARLEHATVRFLFTGDMEAEERGRLLAAGSAAALRADVLKVAHHGSRDGTDPRFLAAVRPRYAVISLGRQNEYGHPHREAVAALARARVTTLRTDRLGDIEFLSDGSTLRLGKEESAGEPPRPEQPSEPAIAGPVIGNRSSRVFHAPGCSGLPAPKRRVAFPSAAAAARAGFRPHACLPEAGA